MDINFQNPPRSRGRRGTGQVDRLREWLSTLEQQGPDKGFALFPEKVNTSVASYIKRGKLADVPAGRFDTTTRNASKGKADLFVRYIGEDQHKDDPPIPEEVRKASELLEEFLHKAS